MDKGRTAKRVVGLKYEPNEGPPQVVLKSGGITAEQVLEYAGTLSKGPAVVKDSALLEKLYRLPVDAPIDTALFQLVAVLLAHVYAADEARYREKMNIKKD